jgi:hypothetical protein
MIIWGSGGNNVDLGLVEHGYCETCQGQRAFRTLLQYRYAHIYWIFSWITRKQYFLLCEICNRGWTLNAMDVEKRISYNPIPFIRQWGWTFLVGLFVLPVLLTMIGAFFATLFGST